MTIAIHCVFFKKYKAKFSTSLILKNRSNKDNFKKIHIKIQKS